MALKVDFVRTQEINTAASGDVPSKSKADNEKARRACQEFESILIYHMLSTMRRAFKTDDEEGENGFGNDIFKSMMDEQLSIALAKSGGIGIAKLLARGLGIDDAAKPDVSRIERRSQAIRHVRLQTKPPLSVPESRRNHQTLHKVLKPYESTIKAAARIFNLSADLIKAVIVQESGGDRYAVSHKGAKGLMQLTDATAHELGVTNPFDPVQNIFGGARLLKRLLDRFEGDLRLALASYNAGVGAVERYGGIPPYKETTEYVEKVLDHLGRLQGSTSTAVADRAG